MRAVMSSKITRPIAEIAHRTLRTAEGDLKLSGKTYGINARPDNKTVAELIEKYPDKFWGWIFLNPRNNPNVVEELEEWRTKKGMIGVKLHPHWHDYRTEILGPLLKRCEELQLPILIHLGFGIRGDFREICSHFPKLKVISAHAGFPFYKDLWIHARDYPNLFVDLSSPYISEELARGAVKEMGPERCLYGTDAPYGFHDAGGSYDYGAIKGWIERLPIDDEKRKGVFGENFAALVSASGAPL